MMRSDLTLGYDVSQMNAGDLSRITVTMDKIPKFANDQEEAEFWDTHDSSQLLDDTDPIDVMFVDARPNKKLISFRLDPAAIDRLRTVAKRKGIGYQTLMRMWVMERLNQEQP